MRAKEVIDNLKAAYRNAGKASTIVDLADIQLMYMIDEARAKLASQKMDNSANVDSMAQHLDVIVERTTEFEDIFDDIVVHKIEIPKPIAYLNGIGVFTLGPIDGRTSFSRISYSEIRTSLYRKYTHQAPKWFWFDDKVYILNMNEIGLEKVRVRGIFDEPWRVVDARGEWKRLAPYDFQYPLTMKDADTVYNLAMSSDMEWADNAITSVNREKTKSQSSAQMLAALKNLGSNVTD